MKSTRQRPITRLPDAHVAESDPKKFRVHPGHARVWRQEGFDFFNATPYDVTLEFPRGVVKPDKEMSKVLAAFRRSFPDLDPDSFMRPVPSVPSGQVAHVEFTDKAPHVVAYRVTVHTPDGPEDAPGGSAPKIIILP